MEEGELLTEEGIVACYRQGVPVNELVAKSKYKYRSSIYRVLKKYGIVPNRNPQIALSDQDVRDLVVMYKSSPRLSALKIAAKYHISGDSVLKILRENGVAIREQPRKHDINEQFFEELNPSVLYISG